MRAVAEDGEIASSGRIATTPAALELFAACRAAPPTGFRRAIKNAARRR